MNGLDDELGRVGDRGVGARYLQAKAHDILVFHELDDAALAEGTRTYLLHGGLLGSSDFSEVDLAVGVRELSIKLLEDVIVLDGAFVKLLLDTCLANGLVGQVVKLRNHDVVKAICGVLAHDTEDCGRLLLELDKVFHES